MYFSVRGNIVMLTDSANHNCGGGVMSTQHIGVLTNLQGRDRVMQMIAIFSDPIVILALAFCGGVLGGYLSARRFLRKRPADINAPKGDSVRRAFSAKSKRATVDKEAEEFNEFLKGVEDGQRQI